MPAPWLVVHRPRPAAALRLFCFPYSGGGAAVFRSWAKSLPSTVEVCAVELPGRGARIREPPSTRLLPLVDGTLDALSQEIDRPFALFGHSLGALVAFEVARGLRRRGAPGPLALFASGRGAPQISDPNAPLHALPEPQLVGALRDLGGTTETVLQDRDVMSLLLPVVRADFEMHEHYEYEEEPPLGCPIAAFGGAQDPRVTRAALDAWRAQTNAGFTLQLFNGGHFFLHSAEPALLRALGRQLGSLY